MLLCSYCSCQSASLLFVRAFIARVGPASNPPENAMPLQPFFKRW